MDRKLRPTVDLTASCACGAVSVHFAGKVWSMFMCSCEDCQRATGAGHSTVAIADPDDVTVTGETKSFAVMANSGATFTRHFCPVCGTPIYGQTSRVADALMLPVGFFGKDTEWYVPNQLIFARSHRDWDAIPDTLPQYQTYRDPGVAM